MPGTRRVLADYVPFFFVPCNPMTYPTYERAFDVWSIAMADIEVSWNRAADPANLTPPVPAAMNRAAELVRSNRPPEMTVEEADRLVDALQTPYPERIVRSIRHAMGSTSDPVEQVRAIAAYARSRTRTEPTTRAAPGDHRRRRAPRVLARHRPVDGRHDRRATRRAAARREALGHGGATRGDHRTAPRRGLALDDDDIGGRLGINRHYVNQVCRQFAREGLTLVARGRMARLVNRWNDGSVVTERLPVPASLTSRKPRRKRAERARSNVEALIADFANLVSRFERSSAFPGPSLYFHEQAIARRRGTLDRRTTCWPTSSSSSMCTRCCPAWGMHRMGKQAAKVGDFNVMVESFRAAAPAIEGLWDLHISRVPNGRSATPPRSIWSVLGALRVSTSATRIVAGSKALHHVLPDLVPPIDRQYTFQFFTGQKAVTTGDERAFLEWFPYLAEIGRRAATEIEDALDRGGFMATGAAKVIDNAIIGFMQGDGGDVDAGEE